jgi:soluble lytic murein transglycosylase-like protein
MFLSSRNGVFCLALLFFGVSSYAWGQTKNSAVGGWRKTAVIAAPKAAEKYGKLIRKSATRNNFPPEVVLAVMLVESGGEERVGLMQVNKHVERQFGMHCNTRKPDCSIRLGTAYLSWLQRKEHGDMRRAIVAYNHGPARVSRIDLNRDHYLAKVESILPETTLLTSQQETGS